MMLNSGDKVFVVHRRLFDKDQSRFFLGTVLGYENGIAKVEGRTLIKDSFSGDFLEKPDARTKIISISSGTLIVYQLPQDTEIESIKFEVDPKGSIMMTDGSSFNMDISEAPPSTK